MRHHHTVPLLLALGLALAATGPAQEADPELKEAIPALVKLARKVPFQAEQLAEVLTRSHAHDPRPFLFLGRLRLELDAGWAAQAPLRRAAELGPASYWDAVRDLQREAGLQPLPIRAEVVDPAAFRARAAEDACHRVRRAGDDAARCPVEGTRYTLASDGALACAHHPHPTLGESPFLVPEDLYRRMAASPEPWLRAEAVRRVDPVELCSPFLVRFRSEEAPAVRRALMERLLGAAPKVTYPPEVVDLAARFAADADLGLRRLAWTLLHTAGRVPALSRADLRELVLAADRGQASKYLVRDVYATDPQLGRAVLTRMLREPGVDGKAVALRVLALDGGHEGLVTIARALERPNGGLLMRKAVALKALQEALGEDHGRDPEAWLRALRWKARGR